MKFTALVNSTTAKTVSPTMIGCRQHGHPADRQLVEQHPAERHDPGGDHLAAHLGQRVQLADVVDRPEQADDAGADEHALQLGPSLNTWPRNGRWLAATIDAANPR